VAARSTSKPRSSRPERITNATRRAVVARDGLQCSWVDGQGHRCPSRAWLEYDHRQPRGKGGGSEPHDVRIFCRAHNQFAAEQAYGRAHMEAFTRRAERATTTPPLKVRDSREPRWLPHGSSHRGPPAERGSDRVQSDVTLQMATLRFGGTTATRDIADRTRNSPATPRINHDTADLAHDSPAPSAPSRMEFQALTRGRPPDHRVPSRPVPDPVRATSPQSRRRRA
jgi:hypothetical protein